MPAFRRIHAQTRKIVLVSIIRRRHSVGSNSETYLSPSSDVCAQQRIAEVVADSAEATVGLLEGMLCMLLFDSDGKSSPSTLKRAKAAGKQRERSWQEAETSREWMWLGMIYRLAQNASVSGRKERKAHRDPQLTASSAILSTPDCDAGRAECQIPPTPLDTP